MINDAFLEKYFGFLSFDFERTCWNNCYFVCFLRLLNYFTFNLLTLNVHVEGYSRKRVD